MPANRVQSKTATTGATTATGLTLTFDAAPAAGNLIIIVVGTNARSPVVTSDATVSWVKSQQIGSASTYHTILIGRVFAGASASVTVTVDTTTTIAMAGAEYSGVACTLDRAAEATGTSTTPDTGAAGTTGKADELWAAGITVRNTNGVTFSAATGGFAIVAQATTTTGGTADRSVCLLERIASATGTPDAGATISASGVWVAQVLTFEAPSAGSSPGDDPNHLSGGLT